MATYHGKGFYFTIRLCRCIACVVISCYILSVRCRGFQVEFDRSSADSLSSFFNLNPPTTTSLNGFNAHMSS